MNYDNETKKLCDQDQLLQMTHMGSHVAWLGAGTGQQEELLAWSPRAKAFYPHKENNYGGRGCERSLLCSAKQSHTHDTQPLVLR